MLFFFFFFQAEDGIRDATVTGVQTCALPIFTAADDPDAMVALPVIGLTGAALVSFLLVLSLPGLITGIGLLQRRPWARIAGIVISIIGMMFIPFGTLIGVYGLWVLFSKEDERLFT